MRPREDRERGAVRRLVVLFPEACRKRTRRWIEGIQFRYGISRRGRSEQLTAARQSVEIGGQVFIPCVLEHASNLVREDAFRR